jgi:energy-coupling factor transporter ATP-binding protein EcfA2
VVEQEATERSASSRFLYVRRIRVDKLFGRYTYDLHLDPNAMEESARLLILYGDNGSGKTTLLQMLFHLIHPSPKGGHRGFLGRKLFRRFAIEFADGTELAAEREGDAIGGSFRMVLNFPDGREWVVSWIVDPDGVIRSSVEGLNHEREFLATLAELNIGLYFLSDDRKIATTRH